MTIKQISISCTLAVALAFSGCGGDSNKKETTTQIQQSGGKVAPRFADNSIVNTTVEENGGVDIATYTVTGDSALNFELQGDNADDFRLTANKEASGYKVKLSLNHSADFETKQSYHVTLVATDEDGKSSSKDISVNVSDIPFSFDIAGNMGAVVAGTTKTFQLETIESKGDVTYSVSGTNFSLNGDTVTFTAPAYNEGGNNNYFGEVEASDGQKTITLTLKASVVKDANAKPDPVNYLLKHKEVFDNSGVIPVVTKYDYEYSNGYLSAIAKSGTNVGGHREDTVYEYEDNYKVMKEYRRVDHQLQSIWVFADKKTDQLKFAENSGLRFSADNYTRYMSNIEDTPALKNNRHLVSHISGLEFHQRKVELYSYNDNDQLTKIQDGAYKKSYTEIMAMTPATLEAGNIPVDLSHETEFEYTNGKLSGRKFVAYREDQSGSDPIEVTYYNNKYIKAIKLANTVVEEYNNDNLLTKNGNKQYIFDDTKMNITVRKNSKKIETYIFEEEWNGKITNLKI